MTMLESKRLNGDIDCVQNDDLAHPSMKLNQLMHNLVQVEGNESAPPSTGKVLEFDCPLSESHTEKSSDDGSMYLNSESIERCLDDYLTCKPDYYNQEVNYCTLLADPAQIKRHDSEFEFVDSMLREVENERDLYLQCNFSSLCRDYLSDSLYEESSLSADPSAKEPERSYFKFQSQRIWKESNASEVSDLPIRVNPMIKPISGQCTSVLDKMDVYELQSAFRSIFGQDTCVTDIQWLKCRISFGMQSIGEVDNIDDIGKSGSLSSAGEDSMILIPGNVLCERVHTFYTVARDRRALAVGGGLGFDNDSDSCKESQKPTCKAPGVGFKIQNSAEHGSALKHSKRLHKPTRRFIEEIYEPKSRCCKERLKPPDDGYRYSEPKSRCYKILQGTSERNLACEDYCATSDIQVHHALPFQKGDHSKSTSLLNYDPMTIDDVSEDILDQKSEDSPVIRNKKKGIHRKQHKQWVLPEVVKLVDGVSQYGVGRWTDIKRQLFSKSPHRTPVDLKDKWRNLLRAAPQPCNQRKVAQDKNGSIHSIPLSVLWRVRDLSVIHPYPRERKPQHLSSTIASICNTSTSPTGTAIKEQGFI